MANSCVILGVPFRSRRRQEFLDASRAAWRSGGQPRIFVTPNPEFLVRAAFQPAFRQLLVRADERLPDGFGLVVAARVLWGVQLSRVTGVDFLIDLCRLSVEQGTSVFLLGGRPGVAERAGETLRRLIPNLTVRGAESGDGLGGWGSAAGLMERIRASDASVLMVAFGAPKQEQWMFSHASVLPNVRILIGVGGALDYLAGAVPRAPAGWRRLGLEWLYRLYRQPWRVGRIVTAVIVFPLLALADRLRQLFSSRSV